MSEKSRQNRFRRTKKGFIAKIYSDQCRNSIKRGDKQPDYNLSELRDWLLNNKIFNILFDAWKKSNHNKMLAPSCDRTDDYQGYSLDRLTVMTWQENKEKYDSDKKNGVNNKGNRGVIQTGLDGTFIAKYHSQSQAFRDTGVRQSNINKCCNGYREIAGGFRWEHAECLK